MNQPAFYGPPPQPPTGFAPPRRRTPIRALVTVLVISGFLAGTAGCAIYRAATGGPAPGCETVRKMPAAEKPIAADLKKRDYGRLLTDVSGLVALEEHAKYKATGVAGGFTLSTRLGTAKSDTEVYEKDVEQFVDTGHLHLYRPTPERLASDQKTVFHDVSTLLTTCDVK